MVIRKMQRMSTWDLDALPMSEQYKDIFMWTYDDLNAYDMDNVPHVLPMESDVNAYQKKLRKMHMKLEPFVKKELNKLLNAKIIFQA